MENLIQNFSHYLNQVSPLSFLVAFLGGVWASFTPCVYPIIPILVGVIGAKGAARRREGFKLSATFVLGMAATYSGLGLFAALTGRLFGQMTTHPLAYFLVGNICLLFALSMLGLFEIRLPGSWGRAALPKQGPSLAAVFLMGASSGVVAAPCTVPVLGVLLTYVAQTRNLLFGLALLFVFALGLGSLPILAGTFTGLLTSLPKSGPWLTRVKQAFGGLLILVGEWFIFRAGTLM